VKFFLSLTVDEALKYAQFSERLLKHSALAAGGGLSFQMTYHPFGEGKQ
jgi:hypothetical protein